ncbi:MAG: CRISPR-associated endonuclease Cas3'', partial [Thermoguttaceae bacterium]
MPDKKIYAHTHPKFKEDKTQWQTLTEHQINAAKLAEEFASVFASSDVAWNTAVLHDLGKIDVLFQQKLHLAYNQESEIEKIPGQVNHSGAGAAFAEEKFGKSVGLTLAYLIAGHHAGLPDYESDKTNSAAWTVRRSEAKENLERIRHEIAPFLNELDNDLKLPTYLKAKNYHLWVRMLFSCLVDADWLDTERFMDSERFEKRLKFPPVYELSDRFWAYMEEKKKKVDKTSPLNIIRNEILDSCINTAEQPSGLFTLAVPTGGGKTLSSMAFALNHAKKHRFNRIIYVIPYTSIIEQTAKVLREIFGDENVL